MSNSKDPGPRPDGHGHGRRRVSSGWVHLSHGLLVHVARGAAAAGEHAVVPLQGPQRAGRKGPSVTGRQLLRSASLRPQQTDDVLSGLSGQMRARTHTVSFSVVKIAGVPSDHSHLHFALHDSQQLEQILLGQLDIWTFLLTLAVLLSLAFGLLLPRRSRCRFLFLSGAAFGFWLLGSIVLALRRVLPGSHADLLDSQSENDQKVFRQRHDVIQAA